MVSLNLSEEQQAILDTVSRALHDRGKRPAKAVLDELGIASLVGNDGNLFDAALVAESAGKHGVVAYDTEALLIAASAVGMAHQAINDAAAYASERVVFGRPIGAYQGVAHSLANAATEIEGTRLLIWRAIAAQAEAREDAAQLASQAFWWTAQACPAAIKTAMRVFGGYGMTEDSNLPHFYRTVRAMLLANGDPDQLLTQNLSAPSETNPVSISFTQDSDADIWQRRTEEFIASQFSKEEKRAFAGSLDNHFPDLHQKLSKAGLLFPDWPTEYGGSNASSMAVSAVRRTLGRNGWPISVLLVSDMIGKLLLQFGTAEAKDEILPKLARGEAIGCLGMSEPSGGSDVFAAKTAAMHDGQNWVINGQKVFTTSAHIADYVLLLTRTKGGLTLFVAPMQNEAIEIHPVQTFAGERTNITYYTDFPIADRYLLGEADKGGKVLGATLSLEHNLGDYYLAALGHVESELTKDMPTIMALPGMKENAPAIRHIMARLAAHIALLESMSIRNLWAGDAGVSQRHYGPMCKLFGTESWANICAELVNVFAPHSLSGDIESLSILEAEARRGIPATIYGGASEIQRSIIAETILGLPKSR